MCTADVDAAVFAFRVVDEVEGVVVECAVEVTEERVLRREWRSCLCDGVIAPDDGADVGCVCRVRVHGRR